MGFNKTGAAQVVSFVGERSQVKGDKISLYILIDQMLDRIKRDSTDLKYGAKVLCLQFSIFVQYVVTCNADEQFWEPYQKSSSRCAWLNLAKKEAGPQRK